MEQVYSTMPSPIVPANQNAATGNKCLPKEAAALAANKKPKRNFERISHYICRMSKDSQTILMEDYVAEITKLRKEVDMLRNVNASLKKEYDEFRSGLLEERLKTFQTN